MSVKFFEAKNIMDQTVKERLVGMGVLLVLGVIFIPLILNGNAVNQEVNNSQNLNLPIPSESVTHEMNFADGNVKRVTLPLPGDDAEQGSDSKNSADTSDEPKASVDKLSTNAIPASGFVDQLPETNKPNSDTKTATASTQDVTLNSTKPIGTIDRSKSTAIAAKPKTENYLKAATDLQDSAKLSSASAWVVQIGSFGDRKNAEKEVASLKVKGFPAFLRRFVTAEDKVLYRVRVGPEKDRARAEKLSERLSKAGIKGQIVADP